jgi:hypothetical protein
MDKEQIAEWLYDGAVALSHGDKERARDLLLRVTEHDETNEEAWLWLSGAVEDIEDQEIALLNVIDLNPDNAAAKKGLEQIAAKKLTMEQQ